MVEGRLTVRKEFRVIIKGPKSKFLDAKLDGKSGAKILHSELRDVGFERTLELRGDFSDQLPTIKLQVSDQITDTTIAYEFDNLEVTNAP